MEDRLSYHCARGRDSGLIPVYLCYFNWGNKHVGIWKEFKLTDDARGDTEKIQQEYETLRLKGKNPEGFITH